MVAEDKVVFAGLRRSWELTRPHWIDAAKMVLAAWLPFIAAAFVMLWLYPEYDQPSWAGAAIANLLLSSSLVLIWLLAVCFYRRALIASQEFEPEAA